MPAVILMWSVLAAILLLVFTAIIRSALAIWTRQHRIVGRSMGCALCGRIIRVIRVGRCLRRVYPFRVGDIVTFVPDESARRAAGVEQEKGPVVFVKRVTEIDGQKFFVEGDARRYSCDSNHFGVIGLETIVGVLPMALQ